MANQPQQLTRPPPRTFTRTDFAALRARVQGVPVSTIARLYYDADTSPQAASAERLEQYLREMRDELVRLALISGSPALADHLRASIRKHGSAKLTAVTLKMVEQAARLAAAAPQAQHGIGLWFRPLIATRLTGEGIHTLGELVARCNAHGGAWWRSMPRIGPHRARTIVAWLHRYRDRPATLRVYTREVERFVLWAVIVRGVAVSSVTVEDCEAYKDFLDRPAPAFCGPRRPRSAGSWRPFTGALSVDSQAYAVRVLRAAFSWLVDVRYLGGNPWHAVQDPATVTRETRMQIHRALPARLWAALHAELVLALRGDDDAARQWRIARAVILLMGDSGTRRAEVTAARREALRLGHTDVMPGKSALWTLTVTGKGRKARTMPLSPATLEALRAHWADRGHDFDAADAAGPLIAPLQTPLTRTGRDKLDRCGGEETHYQVDALGELVRKATLRLVKRLATRQDISAAELTQLASTSAHAYRHTFGTQAARTIPVDVIGAILGHADLQTTSIYVRAERRRMLEAAADYYAADSNESQEAG